MKNYKSIICIAAAVCLLGTAAFCGFRIYHHYAQVDEQTEAFEEIAEMVEQAPTEKTVPDDTPVSEGEDVLGTALRGVWNGVPALCLGVPTNVAISKAGLSQNSQAAWTVQIGLRVTDNGKTEAMSRRQAILSFLIGKATEKPTM